MAQLNEATVRVVNGSATVTHVWDATLSSVSGNFSADMDITWDGGSGSTGGDGKVVAWNSATSRLSFYRTAGAIPTAAEAITDSTTTVSGTIASFYSTSPPNWDTAIPSTGTKIAVFGNSATGNYTVADSGHTADTFALTTNFTGTTTSQITFGIHTDFTPNLELPTIEYGDVDAVGLVTRGLTELDRRGKFRGALITMTADQAIAANTDTAILLGTSSYDTDSFVATANAGFFTVPSGVAKVRLAFSVRAAADVTSTWRVHITKNDTTTYAGFVETLYAAIDDTTAITGQTPVLAVAAGDVFKLKTIIPTTGGSIDQHAATWFSIEAVELTAAS